MAADVPNLLAKADGRSAIVQGKPERLATQGVDIVRIEPSWRDWLLGLLTDPSIVYLLLLAGVGGIAFELSHPGVFAPGVVGAICLLLGGYELNLLPVSYAGLALALLGLGLMIAEAFVPAFGAFVLGGVASFVIGSLMMFDRARVATAARVDPGRCPRECRPVRGRADPAFARPPAPGRNWNRSADRLVWAGRPLDRIRGRDTGAGRALAGPRTQCPATRTSGASRRTPWADPACGGHEQPRWGKRMSPIALLYPVILLLVVAIAFSAVRVMREYQRAVVFTWGRFTGVKGPGLILLVPLSRLWPFMLRSRRRLSSC